jgi:hypothetical protein
MAQIFFHLSARTRRQPLVVMGPAASACRGAICAFVHFFPLRVPQPLLKEPRKRKNTPNQGDSHEQRNPRTT